MVSISLAVNGLDAQLTVTALTGTEAISSLYELELTITSDDTALDLDALTAETAVLTIEHGTNIRHVHGIISLLEQTATTTTKAAYRAVLVPTVWLLDQRFDCRIFQGVTAPELIEKVLKLDGVTAYQVSLQRSYTTRDVRIQYRESDWAFLSRLMEEEGIFYYFEHTTDGCTLMIADAASFHAPLDPEAIAYSVASGLDGDERVGAFSYASRVRPGKVQTRGVSFDNPPATVDATAETTRHTDLLVYDYPSTQTATDHLDALQATAASGEGKAASVRLAPGFRFTMTGHPRDSFNAEYLVTRVQHTITTSESQTYLNTFQCVPATTTFRPERSTPKPVISGPQTGTIVGTDAAEIETDEKGRVRVKLHWDRNGHDTDNACWVHVAQMASGTGYGGMFIPRVGTSVLVGFLDGDIDQPIITGRVYNTVNPYPYTLPADMTRSSIRSQTTPGGGGYNEVRFEDNAGSEELYLRAQRDMNVEALNDATRTIGRDDTLSVAGSRTVVVDVDESTAVTCERTITVGGGETKSVTGDQSVSVASDQWVSIAGDRTLSVAGDARDIVVGDHTQCVGGDQTATFWGDRDATTYGHETRAVSGNHSLSVEGTMQRVVDGQASLTFSALTCAVTDGAATLTATGDVQLESETEIKIGGPNVSLFADSTIRIRAQEKIILEIGNATEADADAARIEITSSGIYVTNGKATEKLSGGTILLNC